MGQPVLGYGEDYWDGRSNAFLPQNTWLSKDQALQAMQRQQNDTMARAMQDYSSGRGYMTAPMIQTLQAVMANTRLNAAASLNYNGQNTNWLNTRVARQNIPGYGAPFELQSWSIGGGLDGGGEEDTPAPKPTYQPGNPRPWNPNNEPTQWGTFAKANTRQGWFPGLAHEDPNGIKVLTPSIPPAGRISIPHDTTDGSPYAQLQDMRRSLNSRVGITDMAVPRNQAWPQVNYNGAGGGNDSINIGLSNPTHIQPGFENLQLPAMKPVFRKGKTR